MNIKEAKEIISLYEKDLDHDCTCFAGNPPCPKCENCPSEEDYNEALKLLNNSPNFCLGCHNKLEEQYHFCSITCACLCGYFNVNKGWLKDPSKITQEEIDNFLNNHPLRKNYPDKGL